MPWLLPALRLVHIPQPGLQMVWALLDAAIELVPAEHTKSYPERAPVALGRAGHAVAGATKQDQTYTQGTHTDVGSSLHFCIILFNINKHNLTYLNKCLAFMGWLRRTDETRSVNEKYHVRKVIL